MKILLSVFYKMANTSKDRLIDTAVALIWKSGYSSISVDEICRQADVKKGSFYYHFPSKADLAVAAMEHYYQLSKPFYDEVFSSHVPVTDRFELLAKKVFEKQAEVAALYGQVCGCPFATLGSEMAGQEESIRKKIESIMEKYKSRYFKTAVQELVDAKHLPANTDVDEKAQELYCYLLGQVMMARIQNDLNVLKGSLQAGLRHILGLSSSKAA